MGCDMTMAQILTFALTAFALLALALHLTSVGLILPRFGRVLPKVACPPLTVLRPVCGAEPGLEATLASAFTAAANIEVIFCVADPEDPAIAVVQRVMARFPTVPSGLLIGEDLISGNPKLNNLAKGWAAARHDWVVMIDSNVDLPADYIQTLFAHWTKGTGLVTSPPAGMAPDGLWAAVEAGFLNSYQDRWQLFSDQIGNGFAQGKVLMWRKAFLDRAGGLAALGGDLAEDVASTKVVRAAGLKVRVIARPFPQPLGQRTASEVWARQVRWARVRRAGFPTIYAAEIFSAAALPFASVIALTLAGQIGAMAALAYIMLWYGAEVLLARRAGWPAQIGAWLLRDALIPAIWLTAFASRGFVWRGNVMHEHDIVVPNAVE